MSSQQAAYLLREFYFATGWNSVDNHYASFTHQSRQVLDFSVQPGLHFSIASHPTSSLSSGLALSSLVPEPSSSSYPPSTAPVLGPPVSPLLAGQLGYLFSTAPLSATSTRRNATGEDRINFKHVIQSYGTESSIPERPELREDVRPTWKSGLRIDKSDYLLYGRLYAPSPRLDALYVHRLNPTTQLLVSLITVPSPTPTPTLSWQNDDPSLSATTAANQNNSNGSASSSSSAGTAARLSELELKLQQDTGRWSSEYSYAVGDGMWGVRGLYNFGKWGKGLQHQTEQTTTGGGEAGASGSRERVVDEEEEMPTGLKGRWSAGGEVYFSAQERSAGLSTGLRFSTIPESAGGPPQPPTTVTATLNPIMGQLSTAYAVQTSRDSSLASRFDFNMYSYDADLTIGGEWFQRKNRKGKGKAVETQGGEVQTRETFDAFGRGVEEGESTAVLRRKNNDAEDEITAVLKVRASTNSDVAMTWEGRLGDFLVSLGLVADLRLATQSRGRVSPIRSVGLGISYWA
ncbi:Mdm10p [Sporobolomyces salmoneus]|uniref:Mdm10p n=1 Tax=Sporobolomyces salmoneus TaxID=183962 RepID=UPI00316BA50D